MKSLTLVAAGVLACLSGLAAASETKVEEVLVQAKREMTTKLVGKTSTGIPILDISLSYGVSTEGIDIATHAGYEEMQKRVNDAASAACEEIGRQYPGSTPDDATCARSAAKKAMKELHKLAHP